jgi:hypothetical protein
MKLDGHHPEIDCYSLGGLFSLLFIGELSNRGRRGMRWSLEVEWRKASDPSSLLTRVIDDCFDGANLDNVSAEMQANDFQLVPGIATAEVRYFFGWCEEEAIISSLLNPPFCSTRLLIRACWSVDYVLPLEIRSGS